MMMTNEEIVREYRQSKNHLVQIGILADEETRIARIMARDGISHEEALLRVRAQRDAQYFIDNCGRVVENNGGAADFTKRFMKALEEIDHG